MKTNEQPKLKVVTAQTKGSFVLLFRPHGVKTGRPDCESICFLDDGERGWEIAEALTIAYPEAAIKGQFVIAQWLR